MIIQDIKTKVSNGDINAAYDNLVLLSNAALKLLETPDDDIKADNDKLVDLVDIISISNILYNNTDRSILPIEDGIYDLLVVKLQRIDHTLFTPGNVPFISKPTVQQTEQIDGPIRPFIFIKTDEDRKRYTEARFKSIIHENAPYLPEANIVKPFILLNNKNLITKRLRNTSHSYPHLVGTLDKAKFVLIRQADELGVSDSKNVNILERDFFENLLRSGLINITDPIKVVGTLKYDGVSIEADVTDRIVGARTRGDTDNNEASDLTEILEGYMFPKAKGMNQNPIGIKFEAIVLYQDLQELNRILGTGYINGRTAIIGLLGSSYSRLLRDYITLVPLQMDDGTYHDRLEEIAYLNKYYANREYLRSVVIEEPYNQLLGSIKTYVDEAEFFRTWSKFMYDGVVIELIDPDLVSKLGRKDNINQYEMAVKFNPLKKSTVFLGYSYTVGQNGVITPILHYQPVEFMGSIHTKCSGASYARFNELNLYEGDIINITYTNDVMPYPSKPDIQHNKDNHNRSPKESEMFPSVCPSCGTHLIKSTSGKMMYCINMDCPARRLGRLSDMLSKLGIKDFSESSIDMLGLDMTFSKLMTCSVDDFAILGPTNSIKLYNQLRILETNPLPDYRIMGALGFSNIAAKTWKLIFQHIPLIDIYKMYSEENNDVISIHNSDHPTSTWWCLRDYLANIKGVGPTTADTIVSELEYFWNDIDYIISHNIYIPTNITNGQDAEVVIRFSGYRDYEIAEVLNAIPGIDCDPDGSVTKKTTLLLIPYAGYSSSKVNKARQYGVPVVLASEFLDTPYKYVPGLEVLGKF